MSFYALLNAIESVFITSGKFPKDVMMQKTITPQPPPYSGSNRFISIFPSDWSATPTASSNNSLDETFSVGIAVTINIGNIPFDKHANRVVLAHQTGLETLCRRILKVMFENKFVILEKANLLLQSQDNRLYKPNVQTDSDTQTGLIQADFSYQTYESSPYQIGENSSATTIIAPIDNSQIQLETPFIEPLVFQQSSGFEYAPAGWFHSENEREELGIYTVLTFSGARRVQSGFQYKGVY